MHEKSPTILIAPLDWGLGHATRCIPIIKELLRLECRVIIATSGDQKVLLQGEFPSLPFMELPGYNVKYGKNRALTLVKIITGIPKILIGINRENRWLKEFLAREKLDAVISDNRYGLYSRDIFSVFITHQLIIKTSAGKIADRLLQRINYRAINHFSLCWVPDRNKEYALAGDLSHPEKMPVIPTRYIGLLSRFGPCGQTAEDNEEDKNAPRETSGGQQKNGGLLILLSGPEPQRTIFEKKILEQLPACPGNVTLLRGLPGAQAAGSRGSGLEWDTLSETTGVRALPARIQVYDHLPAAALNRAICDAQLVISRPGYSSIMDLLKLNKKAVFVPTPGQTEQEYLGAHLAGRKLAICMPQRGFSLAAALTAASSFPFAKAPAPGDWVKGKDRATEAGRSETHAGRLDKGTDLVLEKEIASLLEKVGRPTENRSAARP